MGYNLEKLANPDIQGLALTLKLQNGREQTVELRYGDITEQQWDLLLKFIEFTHDRKELELHQHRVEHGPLHCTEACERRMRGHHELAQMDLFASTVDDHMWHEGDDETPSTNLL
jgi:hypothetical protein